MATIDHMLDRMTAILYDLRKESHIYTNTCVYIGIHVHLNHGFCLSLVAANPNAYVMLDKAHNRLAWIKCRNTQGQEYTDKC